MLERLLLGVILAVAIYFFWSQKLRADLVAAMVMLALIFPWPRADGEWHGILTPQEGFSGFGSAAVIMVTAMFIFGGALVKTGAAEFLAMRLFKAAGGKEWTLQVAILGATVLTSMFVNDTAVVLVFLPLIMSICRERKLSPSRYLMGAAYGSLLGGQWTLIATRSNLIISDYFRQRTGVGFGFFDFTPIAAVIFAVAALYFVIVGRRFLPDSARPTGDNEREYLSEVLVSSESKAIGKTTAELDWSTREDLEIVEILRSQQRLSLREPLRAGDLFILRGAAASVGELLKSADFQLKEEIEMDEETLQSVDLVTVEGILAPNSRYVGRALSELDFKRTYGFTVLGLSRHGRTVLKRPMHTPLAFGDSLLFLGRVDGLTRLRANSNLLLLTEQSFPALGKQKALVILFLLAAVIGLAVTNTVSPVITVPLAAFLAIALGCIRIGDAYNAVDWPSIVTVAAMIPYGLALEKTKTASDIARFTVQTFSDLGPVAVLGAVLLLAVILTQLIENAAVAIILAPLFYSVAEGFQVAPKPFLVGLAICVSAGFCTPFAHESTILVMGPGHYQFKHYLKIGAALALITWLFALVLTPLIWPFGSSLSH